MNNVQDYIIWLTVGTAQWLYNCFTRGHEKTKRPAFEDTAPYDYDGRSIVAEQPKRKKRKHSMGDFWFDPDNIPSNEPENNGIILVGWGCLPNAYSWFKYWDIDITAYYGMVYIGMGYYDDFEIALYSCDIPKEYQVYTNPVGVVTFRYGDKCHWLKLRDWEMQQIENGDLSYLAERFHGGISQNRDTISTPMKEFSSPESSPPKNWAIICQRPQEESS